MTEVTADLNRFRSLIRSLFEFDSSELDFGVYRILKEKRGVIDEFLNKRLPEIVDEAFDEYQSVGLEILSRRLEELQSDVRRTLGADSIDGRGDLRSEFHHVPVGVRYLGVQAELQESQLSDSAKTAIYSYLFTFFSRYYDEGDFI